MKKGMVIILVISATLLFVRTWSPEDSWICTDDQWVAYGNPDTAQPVIGCGTVSTVSEFSFDEMGHFIKDNPGFKPGVWYLSYEKPGAPALSVELEFSEISVCMFNGKKGACPDVLLPSSALTRVRGELKGDKVIVFDAVSGGEGNN